MRKCFVGVAAVLWLMLLGGCTTSSQSTVFPIDDVANVPIQEEPVISFKPLRCLTSWILPILKSFCITDRHHGSAKPLRIYNRLIMAVNSRLYDGMVASLL
jgi:hypothetical protein